MNPSSKTNLWAIGIDKLMLWRGSWTKYDFKVSNPLLRVHYDQLLITAETKILESFNMHSKIKGIYKEDILILIVSNSCKEIRKIKFQIKSDVAQCLQRLSNHFPVIHYNHQVNYNIDVKYRNVDDVLKLAVENKEKTETSNLPSTASLNNFVKLCLLDPTFPQLVLETEKVLNSELFKK